MDYCWPQLVHQSQPLPCTWKGPKHGSSITMTATQEIDIIVGLGNKGTRPTCLSAQTQGSHHLSGAHLSSLSPTSSTSPNIISSKDQSRVLGRGPAPDSSTPAPHLSSHLQPQLASAPNVRGYPGSSHRGPAGVEYHRGSSSLLKQGGTL